MYFNLLIFTLLPIALFSQIENINRIEGEEFQKIFDERIESGYALSSIKGYFVNGECYYDTSWEEKYLYDFKAVHGVEHEEYQLVFDELVGQGYIMVDISMYSDGKKIYFAGIWEKQCEENFLARHGISKVELESIDKEMEKHRLYRSETESITWGDQKYYAAIWRDKVSTKNIVPQIPIIAQPSKYSCWATVATMMYLWRTGKKKGGVEEIKAYLSSMSANRYEEFMKGINDPDSGDEGLEVWDQDKFFINEVGLQRYTQCTNSLTSWFHCNKPVPSVEELSQLLCSNGPLAFQYGDISSHIVIIYNIEIDRVKSIETIFIIDPIQGRKMEYSYKSFVELANMFHQRNYAIFHW